MRGVDMRKPIKANATKGTMKKTRMFMMTCLSCYVVCSQMESISGRELYGDRYVNRGSVEERNYEFQSRKAQDVVGAWSSLSVAQDDEHYIRLVCGSSSLGAQFRGYEVVSVSSHGSFLTVQLQKLSDEDKKKGVSLRASEVARLELLERPW
jgi:hypothetical protein